MQRLYQFHCEWQKPLITNISVFLGKRSKSLEGQTQLVVGAKKVVWRVKVKFSGEDHCGKKGG